MRHPRVTRFTLVSFVAVLLLLLGVLVGCGGEEQEGEEGGGGGQEGEEGGEGAFITATPNPVPTGGGGEPGATTISWSTGSEASSGEVYLAPPADRPQEAERLFAGESTEGSQEAPWIAEGGTYEFRLYAGNERATLLDTVTVTTSAAEITTEITTEETPGVGPVQNGLSVAIQDFFFGPADAAIESGFRVTWINEGNESHTVTADDGSFDSGVLTPGDSFTVVFEGQGTLTYHCEIHPSMAGSVTVG